MIQLRMLGGIELRAGDGAEIRDALVQPKRLALLVYLAAANPGAFHRRDSLMALFWPEFDEPRARDALKQAISYLRRALAPAAESAILSRGADELSLSTQAVQTDLAAFEAAVEEGRDDEALDLYRGDLLEGFFSGGSSDFDSWVSRERTRLRALAVSAAQRLAETRERDGDVAGALIAARRAVSLSELEEPVFRRLLGLLDRAGDRVGAIRAYEAFVARLAAEYDTEPSAETRALMEEIRGRQARHVPQRVAAAAHVTEAPATSHQETRLADVRATRRQWIWAVAAVATILTAVAAMSVVRRDVDPGLNRSRVVVAPFINLTRDSTLNFLGPLIAEGVTRGLAPLDSIMVVSWTALRGANGKMRILTDLGALASVGDSTRAGRVVGGSYSRQGDTLRIQARIVNAIGGYVEVALDPITGSVAAPYEAIERVREAVMTSLQVSQATTDIGTIGRLPSLSAYREFMTAWELGAEAVEARPHLIKASQIDTTFTLAQYWLATNYAGWDRWREADSVLGVLSLRRGTFSPVERELFAETDAYVKHDWERDLRASRTLLRRDSTYSNAGGVAFIALKVNRPRESLETLQRIPVALVERNWAHWNKMALADHMLRDYKAELRVATTARTSLTQPFAPALMLGKQMRALAALGRLSALRQAADSFVLTLNAGVASDGAPSFITVLRSPVQTYEALALELFAHGQRDEALEYVRHGLEWHAKSTGNRFAAASAASDSGQFWLARLLMLDGKLEPAQAIWTKLAPRDTQYEGARVQLAITFAHLGDTVAARRMTETLDSLATIRYAFGRPRVGAARIAAALGHKDDAVRLLRLAMQEGVEFGSNWHSDADFRSLQDYPPFKALLRPVDRRRRLCFGRRFCLVD